MMISYKFIRNLVYLQCHTTSGGRSTNNVYNLSLGRAWGIVGHQCEWINVLRNSKLNVAFVV